MAERRGAGAADFFVSYTQADRAWAEWIAWQLEAAGYSTVLQAWDFPPGSDWAHEMQRATATARRTVAVLSSVYLESVYGEAEWRAAFAADPTGEKGLLVPIRVEHVQPPGLLRTRVYIDLVGVSGPAAQTRLLDGIRQGRSRPEREPPFPGSRTRPPAPASLEPRFPGYGPEITNLPAPNPNFTGRGQLLEILGEELGRRTDVAVTQARAIHGLGGVGKSQLVLEYAHRHAADYELIWWIPAERPTTALAALAALARQLGIQEMAVQQEMMAELFDELRQRDRWLLVYDNAEEPEAITPLLPPGGAGHVLITSRFRAWGRVAEPLPLDVLSRPESIGLLLRRTASHDEESAAALAEFLGDLPLALEEAAAYIEETQIALPEYLQLARERTVELFSLDRPVGDEQRVATTWSVSLDRVRTQTPAAEALLELCAFLAPHDIPRDLPSRAPDRLPSPLAGVVTDPLAYNDVVRALSRYSLAAVTPTAFGVHALIQAVVRARLDLDGRKRFAEAAIGLLARTFPEQSWEVKAWPACQRLLPHVLAVAEHAEELGVGGDETGWLLDRAAAYLHGRGQPRQARPIAERALAMTEAALGPDDPSTGERHHGLGQVLRDLGDLARARVELERAIGIYEAALGPGHLEVAILRGTLAQVLRDMGDQAAARTQLERALGILEAALGPRHPDVGGVRTEIANLLWDRGDLIGAKAHLEQALAIYEATYGPDHPAVATVRSSLGTVLHNLGDLGRARVELERALAIYEATYGPDHPEIAIARNKLGLLLWDLGDLGGARVKLEGALASYEATYGPDHPNVARFSAHLGGLLHILGELERARVELERALAVLEAAYGPNHPDVIVVRANLKRVLQELGDGGEGSRA
jgi:tetratricopeptide (TPR) repeat protein